MDALRSVSVLLLWFFACTAQSSTIVKHLPGFNGPLPFYLETGYVMVDEANGGELFYYFIESEGNPSKDPVLLWLTGGHRCSSLSGLLFEIGPLKIVKAPYNGSTPELEYHPYAWTKHASIIFLDSALGSGFSYSSNPKGYEVSDSIAARQINKFLMQWFMDHPHHQLRSFYVAGDSYAGKIVPVVAQLISEGIETDQQPLFNLKGYLVGNPYTGEKIDLNSRVPYAHGVGIISDQLYELAQKSCKGEYYSKPSSVQCTKIMTVVKDLMSQVDEGHVLDPPCMQLYSPVRKDIIQNRRFLKDDYSVQSSKPMEPPFYCRGTKNEWQRCVDLPYEEDIRSSIKYHYNLTSKGYRALVYSGDHDMVIPFLGTQAWLRSLNFSVMDAWRAWHVNGQTAGFTETYSNNMTFATVRNGGHTAPEFRPVECLGMFERWISNRPL